MTDSKKPSLGERVERARELLADNGSYGTSEVRETIDDLLTANADLERKVRELEKEKTWWKEWAVCLNDYCGNESPEELIYDPTSR